MPYRFFYILCIGYSFLLCIDLYADDSHQRDMIVGGKAALLGGAFAGISEEVECIYHNPAGTAFSDHKKFTANGNFFYQRTTRYLKTIKDEPFVQQTSASVPSFIGSTYSLGLVTVGSAIITTNTRDTKQADYFDSISERTDYAKAYSRFHQESMIEQLYGATLALNPSKNFSVGLSLFALRKSLKSVIHQLTVFGDNRVANQDQSQEIEGYGVFGVLGFLYRGKNFSIGLTHGKTQELAENIKYVQDVSLYASSTQTMSTNHFELDELEGKYFNFPQTSRLGISFNNAQFLVAADVLWHHALTSSATSQNPTLMDTYNFSLGATADLGFIRILSGIFTNYDQSPKIVANQINQRDHIDYYGGSLGFSYETKEYSSSIGFVGQQGSGYAQKISYVADIQKVTSSSSMIILNGSYLF